MEAFKESETPINRRLKEWWRWRRSPQTWTTKTTAIILVLLTPVAFLFSFESLFRPSISYGSLLLTSITIEEGELVLSPPNDSNRQSHEEVSADVWPEVVERTEARELEREAERESNDGGGVGKDVEGEVEGEKDEEKSDTAIKKGERVRCKNGLVYVYTLPEFMNVDLVRSCREDECEQLSHSGLGPAVFTETPDEELKKNLTSLFLDLSCWFKPHLNTISVTYHARLLQHPCRTTDPEKATAFYLPVYGDIFLQRVLKKRNETLGNELSEAFLAWLVKQPHFVRNGGNDHFMVVGNNAFNYLAHDGDSWGCHLLRRTPMQNMTILATYRFLWESNEMGVPYSTFYHPSTDDQFRAWQRHVREWPRTWRASFVGSKKRSEAGYAHSVRAFVFRAQVMDQCQEWRECGVVDCQDLGMGETSICHHPEASLRMQLSSDFCLQPPGDEAPRKGTFDGMVAGCIPVFFTPESAYYQYLWHLPADPKSYSVLINKEELVAGNVTLMGVLSQYSTDRIAAMRQLIIDHIMPHIIIANPDTYAFKHTQDAVDRSVEGVLTRIARQKAGLTYKFPNPYEIYSLPLEEVHSWLQMPN